MCTQSKPVQFASYYEPSEVMTGAAPLLKYISMTYPIS